MSPILHLFPVKFSNRKHPFGRWEEQWGDSAAPAIVSKMRVIKTMQKETEIRPGGAVRPCPAAGSWGQKDESLRPGTLCVRVSLPGWLGGSI